MKYNLILVLGALVASLSLSAPARAEIDIGGGLLLGSGVDTGEVDNNPYALQLGGYGELVLNDFVLGIRGTRSLANDDGCTPAQGPGCKRATDLRSLGGDVGFEWDILMLHIGPRLGFGRLKERDGTRVAGYIEPGGVLDVELLMFNLGIDLRYRIAFNESDLSAFLAYARLGLRF